MSISTFISSFQLEIYQSIFFFYGGNGLPRRTFRQEGKFCRRPLAVWLTVFTKETSAVDSRGHRSLYGVFLQTVEANGDSDCPCSQEKVSHTVFNKRGGWQGRPFCLNRPSAVISIPISVLPCLAHKRLLKPVFTWRNTWMFWSYKYINIDKPTH